MIKSSAITALLMSAIPGFAASTPYGGTPVSIAGPIKAVYFDNGGEGVAYHDTNANNNGNIFRTSEGVDIYNDPIFNYTVGWTYPGEWLNYTIYAPTAGQYLIYANVGSTGNFTGGQYQLSFDAGSSTVNATIPNTNGSIASPSILVGNVYLASGTHVMRLNLLTSDPVDGFVGNFNAFQFNPTLPIPTNFIAGNNGDGQVGLAWKTTLTGGETFSVKRLSGGTYTPIASGLQNPDYVDHGLTNGVQYSYVVNQTLNGVTSPDTAPVSATPNGVLLPGLTLHWADDTVATVYSDAVTAPFLGNHAKLVKQVTYPSSTMPHAPWIVFDETCPQDARWTLVVQRTNGQTITSNLVTPNANYHYNAVSLNYALVPGDIISLYFEADYPQSYPMTNTRLEVWW